MKILVLGTGLQGRAAIHDLVASDQVSLVVAADSNLEELQRYAASIASDKLTTAGIDAGDGNRTAELMRTVDAAIVLIPPEVTAPTAAIAAECGCHWLDASYSRPEYVEAGRLALKNGVTLLPEFGLDPGIDLVMARAVVDEMDQIDTFYSYGTGIPEPTAATNPLKYKISWSLAGVLGSYRREAVLVKCSQPVVVPGSDIFLPEHVHSLEVDGLGSLEAYPNGDAFKYLKMFALDGTASESGRFSLRWPGHTAFWRVMSGLGFLNEEPVQVGSALVVPREVVRSLLAAQLQYQPNERDIAMVRIYAVGLKNGRRCKLTYQLLDYRDLESGLLAMQRTVGFTISIGAQMIVRGDITKRGLLSPTTDVPAAMLFTELAQRGIQVKRKLVYLD